MARAAAKRRPPVRHDHDRKRHKDSGGQRFEDTLFFNRLRKRAKWVFVLLIVVFGLGFVLFGVGSSGLGLGDIFSGIRSGGSGSSVKRELKRTQEHPKDAQAWHDLATAYDSDGNVEAAIGAWTTYTELRPKDVDGLTRLATDYTQQLETQSNAATLAAYDQQSAQNTNFGPPADSQLGRAFGSVSDPIAEAIGGAASQRYNEARQQFQSTASSLVSIYQRIAKLQPKEPSARLQLAQAAQEAGDAPTAIAAYQKFIELAPYDNAIPFAKQQIKTLKSQIAAQGP